MYRIGLKENARNSLKSKGHKPHRGSRNPLKEPWDILRGKCVFKNSAELKSDLLDSTLSHWAPNCATFSRAREIPIRGVKSAPRPIRSESSPRGIPEEVTRMSKKARTRLELDTSMADMAALECADAHRQGKGFTLEHPGRSIALELPSWKALREMAGVREINYHTCMFKGSRRKKYQVLITNKDEFNSMGKLCKGSQFCCRTGERHLKWRPSP